MQRRRRRKAKSTSTKKGKVPFTRDSTHPPHRSSEPDQTLPTRGPINDPNQDVFADTSRAHQDEGESEGEEGTPVAALLQRNAVQLTLLPQLL